MSEPHVIESQSIEQRRRRVAELTERLASSGHRLTPQRLFILEALVADTSHPTAEELFARVRQTCPTTSLATVYKTLETLRQMGEVLELEFSDGSNHYDALRPAAHPHVICEQCGRIEDVEVDGISRLQAHAMQASGYQLQSHRIEFYGLCQSCQ
jgi:Fur family transcriptional regulator, peroxide stress response regulator